MNGALTTAKIYAKIWNRIRINEVDFEYLIPHFKLYKEVPMMAQSGVSSSVLKAFAVLDLIAARAVVGISLNDASQHLSVSKSTAHRYLQTLEALGVVKRDERDYSQDQGGQLRREVSREGLEARTPYTVTSLECLQRELEEIRQLRM